MVYLPWVCISNDLELNVLCLDVPGYGKGYNMAHKDVSHLTYMPKGLENVDFFGPSESV
jgi:hypothetical protein